MRISFRRITKTHLIAAAVAGILALVGAAWAVRVPPGETPYLRIAGASFLFNYRLADSYYGFTAQVMKPVETASRIEASFEDPAGGPDHVVTAKLWPAQRQYGLRSPPLHGILKDRPYRVTVRLLRQSDGAVLFAKSFTVVSGMSDAAMPTEPMTIGPGYTPNPKNRPAGD